jgi:hypothetical protein
MIQLVYGTACPTGWKEKTELRGQVIAAAPAPATGGTTNKQPPLGANETGRVGPHTHAATAKITDTGHTHANTLTDLGHTHKATVTDPGHGHGTADPGHAHSLLFGNGHGTVDTNTLPYSGASTLLSTNVVKTGIAIQSGKTGLTVDNAAMPAGVSIQNAAATSGVTADIAVQPTAAAYYPLAYVIACVRA